MIIIKPLYVASSPAQDHTLNIYSIKAPPCQNLEYDTLCCSSQVLKLREKWKRQDVLRADQPSLQPVPSFKAFSLLLWLLATADLDALQKQTAPVWPKRTDREASRRQHAPRALLTHPHPPTASYPLP